MQCVSMMVGWVGWRVVVVMVVMVVIRKRMKQIASQSNTAQHDEDELQVPSLSTEDWLAVARLGMCCN